MNVASMGEACGDEEEKCVFSVILTTPREDGMALGKGKPKGHSHEPGRGKKTLHQSGAFCKLKPRPPRPGTHRWTQRITNVGLSCYLSTVGHTPFQMCQRGTGKTPKQWSLHNALVPWPKKRPRFTPETPTLALPSDSFLSQEERSSTPSTLR